MSSVPLLGVHAVAVGLMLLQSKRSVIVNGIDGLCVTKLDVLDGLEEVGLCVGYEVDGKRIDVLPYGAHRVLPH